MFLELRRDFLAILVPPMVKAAQTRPTGSPDPDCCGMEQMKRRYRAMEDAPGPIR